MVPNNRPQLKAENSVRTPQLRVRCDVHAGDDLSTCQWNVSKWQAALSGCLRQSPCAGLHLGSRRSR